jgi:hypothetical protein
MKYLSSGAFRRSLEYRLLQMSLHGGGTLVRLRKLVAFDRFLARLIRSQPDQWVIKGGFALQLRLGDHARTTKDIDMLLITHSQAIYPALQKAAAVQLDDWFTFEVIQAERQPPGPFGGVRHPIQCLLDGRTFENFHVDVGVNNPIITRVDYLNTSSLLAFADMDPVRVPCYPVVQQLAEKLHAYTRPRSSGEPSRVKDFVDILLLAGLVDLEGTKLLEALQATFTFAGTHPLPSHVPLPPQDWPSVFEKMAHEVGLKETHLNQAYECIQQFFDPLLEEHSAVKLWDHTDWIWK